MNQIEQEKKQELDDAQKKAVQIKINSVVSAGAGSGKTKVLASRFTELLLKDRDCGVDQILTLTFTKKATVEMNSRIYAQLSSVLPEKAKDFFKANIKTIDSYCASIAREGCRFYGISPDFAIDDVQTTKCAENLAVPFILQYRDNLAIKALVETKDFSQIAKQLFVDTINNAGSIVKKIDFDETLKKQYEFVNKTWISVTNKIKELIQDIQNLIDSYDGNKTSKYISGLELELSKQMPEIPALDFSLPNSPERNKYISYLKNICAIRQSSVAPEIKDVHNELREQIKSLCSLENYVYGTQFVNSLIPLLEEFQELVNNTKRNLAILSYKDVADLALKILIEYPEIRQQEKEKYRYIMIDEFQDNNSLQRDLLFLVAEKKERKEKSIPLVEDLEKGKLFFVGDEKQSIYKFRGADVSVFRGLANNFKNGNLELKTNYRSHPSLIAAFNSIFGGHEFPPVEQESSLYPCVFYTQDDVEKMQKCGENIPDYEAIYHKVEIPFHKLDELNGYEENEIFEPHVHVALYNSETKLDDSYLDTESAQATWVALKIKDLISGKYNGENGKSKKHNVEKYSPSDIAILFRSYTSLPIFEKTFLNNGIPFVSETVKGFFADGPVNDIMSFLRLTAYPKDKLSFANILRSPFVNLCDEETKIVLAVVDNNKNFFEQSLQNILSDSSMTRYLNCQKIYYTLKELVKHEPLAKIISWLWYETGYRYETLWNKTVFMYATSYDRLFELARQADLDNIGLAEFVDSLDGYQSEKEKLDGLEIPLEVSDGVHIMSIHKSKGLEFKVVFVCSVGNRGKRESNSAISYYSKEYGITINTPQSPVTDIKQNCFYDKQLETEKQMICAELRRLTYVALTRAEQRLFIIGATNFSKIGETDFTPKSGNKAETILDILMPAISRQVEKLESVKKNQKDFQLQNSEHQDIESKTLGQENLIYAIKSQKQLNSPFTFETIEPRKKDFEKKVYFSKDAIIEKVKPLYDVASVIEKQESENFYISPSQLHIEDEETLNASKKEIVVDKVIPFYQIDELVKFSAQSENLEPEFTYANFGTIVHAYIECAIKKLPMILYNQEITGLHGDKHKLEELEKNCLQMKNSFLKSEIGKAAISALEENRFCESEFSFKSRIAKKIVNGQIDLVFENKNSDYVIVDYKTNRNIEPKIYFGQMACYRDAIAKMLNIEKSKIKCFLFYLRYGKEFDVTQDCDSVDLEKIVNNF